MRMTLVTPRAADDLGGIRGRVGGIFDPRARRGQASAQYVGSPCLPRILTVQPSHGVHLRGPGIVADGVQTLYAAPWRVHLQLSCVAITVSIARGLAVSDWPRARN